MMVLYPVFNQNDELYQYKLTNLQQSVTGHVDIHGTNKDRV